MFKTTVIAPICFSPSRGHRHRRMTEDRREPLFNLSAFFLFADLMLNSGSLKLAHYENIFTRIFLELGFRIINRNIHHMPENKGICSTHCVECGWLAGVVCWWFYGKMLMEDPWWSLTQKADGWQMHVSYDTPVHKFVSICYN